MLIFYRLSGPDLAQKEKQRSEIGHTDPRLRRQSHQAAAGAIKHPLRNFLLTGAVVTWRRTEKNRLDLGGGPARHSLAKPWMPWINNFADC